LQVAMSWERRSTELLEADGAQCTALAFGGGEGKVDRLSLIYVSDK